MKVTLFYFKHGKTVRLFCICGVSTRTVCQYFFNVETTGKLAEGGHSTIFRCCFFWLIVENLPTGKMISVFFEHTVAVRKKGRKV